MVRKLSLRARLVVGVLVLALVGLAAADVATYTSLRSFLVQRVDTTLESDHQSFEGLDGVVSTTVGYTGGHTKNPTYEDVSAGRTGHAESVQVVYDPARISYARLLDIFWHNVDPLTANAQFCDHDKQYRSAIFYHDETQHHLAEASKERV